MSYGETDIDLLTLTFYQALDFVSVFYSFIHF